MEDWPLSRLLYEGESITETVDTGRGRVAVTSHRVLLVPDDDGEAYRTLERPNVAGVEAATAGGERWIGLGVRAAVATVAFAGFGVVLRHSGVASVHVPQTGGAGAVGIGGFTGLLRGVFSLLRSLDEAAFALAAVAALAVAACAGLAWYGRERRLSFALAGDETVSVAVGRDPEAVAADVQRALDGDDGPVTGPRPPS